MTLPQRLAWHIHASNSIDALELAKERARADGWVIRGVSRVEFTGAGIWVVWLTVRPKEVAMG
jgi:hypothetical protein